jgi:hypothetical protein
MPEKKVRDHGWQEYNIYRRDRRKAGEGRVLMTRCVWNLVDSLECTKKPGTFGNSELTRW